MNHRIAILIVSALLNATASRAQSPKFDAAAIRLCTNSGGGRSGDTKQSKGGSPFGGFSVSPGRLNTGCCPRWLESANTAALIQRVYGRLRLGHTVPPGTALPISGGPAWVYSDAYDINAVAPGNASEEAMEGPMLQALLEDRFKLIADPSREPKMSPCARSPYGREKEVPGLHTVQAEAGPPSISSCRVRENTAAPAGPTVLQ